MMIPGERFRMKCQYPVYSMAVKKPWGEDCILWKLMLYFIQAAEGLDIQLHPLSRQNTNFTPFTCGEGSGIEWNINISSHRLQSKSLTEPPRFVFRDQEFDCAASGQTGWRETCEIEAAACIVPLPISLPLRHFIRRSAVETGGRGKERESAIRSHKGQAQSKGGGPSNSFPNSWGN